MERYVAVVYFNNEVNIELASLTAANGDLAAGTYGLVMTSLWATINEEHIERDRVTHQGSNNRFCLQGTIVGTHIMNG